MTTVVSLMVGASALWPNVSLAHGGVGTFVQRLAGPYEVAFGTSPRTPSPGSPLHVSLRVIHAENGRPVPEADVAVSGQMVGENGTVVASFGELSADIFEEDPVFWDLDLTVQEEGEWTFTVEVQGNPGEGTADFTVRVRDSSPVPGILTIVGLIAFLVVVALAMRAYLGARKARSN